MAKNNNSNMKDIIPIVMIAGMGVGGYFLYKYFKKDEEEKKGFIWLRSEITPPQATIGETITAVIIGKNNTEESHLCFIKLINQETGELLTPLQSAQVGAGLSKQFTFEFVMPDTTSLRFSVHFGRIIDGDEKIDDTQVYTIKEAEPGYPKEICRDPYCFTVYTQQQETQMKDFLGIEPEGAVDLDTYLINSAQWQRDDWKDYWIEMWTSLHRADIVEFVIEKYNEYSTSARIDNFTITSTLEIVSARIDNFTIKSTTEVPEIVSARIDNFTITT